MSDQAISTPSDRKLVDLDRLTQADVARLIGKPTSYLRNHEHRFERDAEGRYSGRQVVAAMLENLAIGMSATALSLVDDELARRLSDQLGIALDRKTDLHATLRFAAAVQSRYGVVGLAAAFSVFIDHCKLLAEISGPLDAFESALPTIFDVAAVCEKCGAVRRGREWGTGPKPPHFLGDLCPLCSK